MLCVAAGDAAPLRVLAGVCLSEKDCDFGFGGGAEGPACFASWRGTPRRFASWRGFVFRRKTATLHDAEVVFAGEV